MTTKVEKSVQVNVPVHTAYNQWTQFEEFPNFMSGVSEVRQLDDRRLHWKAQIAGVKREWDAEILEQVPDERVAWAATEGATNAGAVYFSPVGEDQTLVRLSLEYEPEGLVEKAGDLLKIVEKQAEGDLERFKQFIESRGEPTGAWRGSVNEDSLSGTPTVAAAQPSRGDSGKPGGMSTAAKVAGVAAAAAGVAAAGVAAKKSGGSEKSEGSQTEVQSDVEVVTTGVSGAPVTTDTYTTVTEGTTETTSTYPVAPDSPAATEGTDYTDEPGRSS